MSVTAYTLKKQKEFLSENFLDIGDKQDFEDADRGLVAQLNEPIMAENGTIWNPETYAHFLKSREAPDTINPSLWRHVVLSSRHGLFKVKDGIWQVRGYDAANITFVEGKTGYIIIDTLTNRYSAKASLELFFKHIPRKPITAVIYTHSHLDHWGGSQAIVSLEDAQSGKIPVIAPDKFIDKTVSESILAGPAMQRRGLYMFGTNLEHSETGNVGVGFGSVFGSEGFGLVPPNIIIKEPYETHTYDGVELIFQLTPETEAPSEMTIFLPGYKAFCPAELCNQTFHNIYTIRGAETRDAKAWAGYINEAIHKFGGKFDVVFLTHNWPVWGEERSLEYLKKQRDIYKYVHDQTLHLANAGYTIDEVGDKIKLPKSLSETWSVRGNYGTVSHNAKAVYNRYLGYYDANPSNLNPLPPEEAAVKFLEYFGGAKQVLEKAKHDFDKGEYRWVATVLRYVVFAEPENQEARKLLAGVYEQLGYASESAPWRNAYLTGAQELLQTKDAARNRSNGVLSVLSIGYLFDLLAVQLNGERADGKKLTVNFEFTDVSEKYTLYLENSVINYWIDKCEENADATVIISKEFFLRVFSGEAALDKLLLSGEVKVTGNPLILAELFGLIDKPNNSFNIVLP